MPALTPGGVPHATPPELRTMQSQCTRVTLSGKRTEGMLHNFGCDVGCSCCQYVTRASATVQSRCLLVPAEPQRAAQALYVLNCPPPALVSTSAFYMYIHPWLFVSCQSERKCAQSLSSVGLSCARPTHLQIAQSKCTVSCWSRCGLSCLYEVHTLLKCDSTASLAASRADFNLHGPGQRPWPSI